MNNQPLRWPITGYHLHDVHHNHNNHHLHIINNNHNNNNTNNNNNNNPLPELLCLVHHGFMLDTVQRP